MNSSSLAVPAAIALLSYGDTLVKGPFTLQCSLYMEGLWDLTASSAARSKQDQRRLKYDGGKGIP